MRVRELAEVVESDQDRVSSDLSVDNSISESWW